MTIIHPTLAPATPAADHAETGGGSAQAGDGFGAVLAKARGADVPPAATDAPPARPGSQADASGARVPAPGGQANPTESASSAQAAAVRLLNARWRAAPQGAGGTAGLTQALGAPGQAMAGQDTGANAVSGSARAPASGVAVSGVAVSGQALAQRVVSTADAAMAAQQLLGAAAARHSTATATATGGKTLPPPAADAAASAGSGSALALSADAPGAVGGEAGRGGATAFTVALRQAGEPPPLASAVSPSDARQLRDSLASAPQPAAQSVASASLAVPAAVPALAGAVPASPGPQAPATYAAILQLPVGNAAWGQELGQQMLFAVGNQQQLASLKLNPPHLGPLEVHLQLDNGQVNAQFVSPHQAVRQALESAMPQLHDMFAGAGMNLAQASVGSGGGRNLFQQAPRQRPGSGGGAGEGDEHGAVGSVAPAVRAAVGLVNTYV